MALSFLASVAAPVLTGLATNWLGQKLGGNSQSKQQPAMQPTPQVDFSQFQQVPMISQYDAVDQASSIVDPMFDKQLNTTLKNVDYGNMQRGFYGQLPGDVLKGSRAADVEANRASQTANLAQQLYQQAQANALSQQQMQMSGMLNQQQLAQNWNMGQQQLGQQQKQNTMNNWLNLGNSAVNAIGQYYGWTGQLPWQGNPLESEGSKNTTKQTLEQASNMNLGAPSTYSNVPGVNNVPMFTY